MHVLLWLAVVLAMFAAVVSVLPLIHTGNWVARSCDFPRAQIMAVCALGGVFVWIDAGSTQSDWRHLAVAAVLLGVAVWQGAHFMRYTPIWRCQVSAKGERAATLRLLVANLDYENRRKPEVARAIGEVDVDVMVLIEVDAAWREGLSEIFDRFEHRHEVVRGDGLGMCMLSRHPLHDARTEHLVSERRASIHAEIRLEGTDAIRVVALHPTPPGLDEDGVEGRRDSRERDAELVLVAKKIREEPDAHWVVCGDLNDVAWSHTTRLFRRLSGMRDPRIGRKLLNTFHAEYFWLRYPLDHVFLSPALSIPRLERVRVPGSDHFGVIAEVGVPGSKAPRADGEAEATAGDEKEASRIEREGKRDAAEVG